MLDMGHVSIFRSSLDYVPPPRPQRPTPPPLQDYNTSAGGTGGYAVVPPVTSSTIYSSSSSAAPTEQFGHCPKGMNGVIWPQSKKATGQKGYRPKRQQAKLAT